jgi:FAD:protein FMN transferase
MMFGGTDKSTSASWRALGTSVVLKLTDPGATAQARRIVEEQLREIDRACSRFRADSELERVNARAGAPVRVGPLLLEAVEVGLRAARLTDGDVDPALGKALMIAGYDRDYELLDCPAAERDGVAVKRRDVAVKRRGHEEISATGRASQDRRAVPRVLARRTAGWRTIAVDHERSTIRVGRGVRLDLGATAKALAADRAAYAVNEATGAGVLVSLGGDIALAGPGPAGGWRVFVTDDHRGSMDREGQMIAISSGGLASSSTTTRRWTHEGRRMHHIIDPDTDAPVRSRWRTVSVAAASCVDANIASTAALVRGSSAVGWLAESGLPARLVAQDGNVLKLAGWPAELEREPEVVR